MVELKDELLTVAEAARELKVTTYTIYRWIAQGRLPSVRYSRRVLRVRKTDLERMGVVTRSPTKPGPKHALLEYAGLMTHAEAEELRRVIREAKTISPPVDL